MSAKLREQLLKAWLLSSKKVGKVRYLKKTQQVKTTKLKVLSESDVYFASPPELAQLMATRGSIH